MAQIQRHMQETGQLINKYQNDFNLLVEIYPLETLANGFFTINHISHKTIQLFSNPNFLCNLFVIS